MFEMVCYGFPIEGSDKDREQFTINVMSLILSKTVFDLLPKASSDEPLRKTGTSVNDCPDKSLQ